MMICQEIFPERTDSRRPGAVPIAVAGVNVCLIQGYVKFYALERSGYFFRISYKIINSLFIFPSPLLCYPNRQCPMPKCDKWLHSALAERTDYLAIMLDFFFVPLPFFRLNARPFDGKAVRVVV